MEMQIIRYNDGKILGTVEMSDAQVADYESAAQQPEGLIRLGDLHGCRKLAEEYGESTTVYIQ